MNMMELNIHTRISNNVVALPPTKEAGISATACEDKINACVPRAVEPGTSMPVDGLPEMSNGEVMITNITMGIMASPTTETETETPT